MGKQLYYKNSFELQGLIEIVFGPDLFHGEEAASLVKELILILQRLEACNCQMDAGALRIDANISIRPYGTEVLGTILSKIQISYQNS